MKEIKGSIRRRYARLPLALALGAMVLTPAVIGVGASEAEASVAGRGETSITLSGDARIRGFWREEGQLGNQSIAVDGTRRYEDKDRQLQHRLRLAVDINAAGGTSIHTRLLTQGGGHYTWDGGNGETNVATDYLFFRVPVADATVTVGRQVVNWGHRLKAWNLRRDRLRVDYRMNDEVSLFGYYQKNWESQNRTVAAGSAAADFQSQMKDEDINAYSAGVVYRTSPLTYAVQLRHTHDERNSRTVTPRTSQANLTRGESGQELFGHLTYRIDNLTLLAEADVRFGTFHDTYYWDGAHRTAGKKHALFLGADYAMGDTTLKLSGVFAKNGFESDGDFDRLGIAMNTAHGSGLGFARFGQVANFGASPANSGNDTNAQFAPNDRQWGVALAADHSVSQQLTLSGNIAYVHSKMNGYSVRPTTGVAGSNEIRAYDNRFDTMKMTSVDATMAYRVNASTTYHINAVYAKFSGSFFDQGAVDGAVGSLKNDAYWGIGHRFEITF